MIPQPKQSPSKPNEPRSDFDTTSANRNANENLQEIQRHSSDANPHLSIELLEERIAPFYTRNRCESM